MTIQSFTRQPNPERGLFMDIQKKYFINIYGSLMDIYDEKKQRHFCRNIASRASQTPKGVIYGHSKKIIYEHLWLIDGHL